MKKTIYTYIFLLASFLINAQTQVVIGPQSSTFSSMVRGYHFTAPTNFNLCALYIPQDASTGVQHIAVVQFNPAAPPAFPGTTNAFTVLFSQTNIAAGTTVAVNIPMTAGVIYGIYGARAASCVNSYDGTNYVANIAGFPATLSRSGMQACLGATPMANIWSEVNYSIGRIFMYYNCCPTPTITTAASATNICSTTSVTILGGGATTYTWMPGNVQTASIAVTPTASTTYTLSGSSLGCTGTKTIAINVNATPTINSVSNNGPVCQGSALSFNVNSTTAGVTTYSWNGPNAFQSNLQNPSVANTPTVNSGVYTVSVTNTFAGPLTCVTSGTTSAVVVPVAQVVAAPATGTGTICQGTSFNLSANASGSPTYQWTGPGFSSTSSNTSIANATPVNSGNYSVTASYSVPGSTLICSSSAVSNLSVVPINSVAISVSPNLCQHTTATLTANAAGAAGYQWTGPNNYFSSSQNNTITSVQPVSAGPYNVTALFTIGTVTCSSNNSAQMNVVPVNSIAINPPVSVCYPANVSLQASASGAMNYIWSGPSGFTANVANPTLYVPTATATGVYTVTSLFNNGILTCMNTNTTSVTVNPVMTFSLPAFTRVCNNTSLLINGPAGATSYTWTSSSGFTSNSQNLSIPGIQPNQTGTYTLTLHLGPCISKAATQIEVLTPMQLTLTPNSRQICDGDSVEMVMGATGGSQNYAYQWNPAVFIGSPTGSVATGVPHGTTIYQVTGYDIACPQFSVTHSFTVQVNQPPKPDLVLDKASGCQPLCLFFDAKTKQNASITTYNFGGIYKMQGDSFRFCLNEPGIYNLKISTKGKNGCYGEFKYEYPITVFPKPGTDITWDPETPTTTNNQVTFYPSHKYGPVVNYAWMFQGTANNTSLDTSNLKNPFRIYENVGKFPVMLVSTTDHGCIDTTFKILDIRDEMGVYIPNTFTPNGDGLNDFFQVKGIGLRTEGFSMDIFDRWGAVIYSTRDILKGWDGTNKGLPVKNDVYVYKIKIIGANGEGKKEYIGHVTILK
jgi:gliding motility-associated-like protein